MSPWPVQFVIKRTKLAVFLGVTPKFSSSSRAPWWLVRHLTPSDLIRPHRSSSGLPAFTGGTLQSSWTPAGTDSPANIAERSNCQVLLVMRLETQGLGNSFPITNITFEKFL